MTSPSGTLAKHEESLRSAIADCATFRTLVGAADQAAAMRRVHLGDLPDPGVYDAILTKRDGGDSGELTIYAGHDLGAGDSVTLTWSGGKSRSATVADATALVVTVHGGDGDSLPAKDTELVVTEAAGLDRYRRSQLEAMRPYAIVFTAENDGYARYRVSSTGFLPRGVACVFLERSVASADTVAHGTRPSRSARQAWVNIVGSILDEICALCGSDSGYLDCDEVQFVAADASDPKQIPSEGLFQRALLFVRWGGG